MSTILVTGVAGFIASKVAEFLLADGYSVLGIDDLNDAYDVRLKHWRLERISNRANFSFKRLDIRDRQSLYDLFAEHRSRGFNAVINLAARAGVRQSVENPWLYFETNTTGTLNLLELCREFAVAKFVLASTSSLYGRDNPMPWQENQDTSLPLSPYSASKKAAEVLCHTYHYLYGIDITILRYFTVYGPAGRPDMSLFRFVQWIREGQPVTLFGDGQQSRDFTYIDDIARGTVAALRPLGYEIINLGSDQPVVLLDTVNMIEHLVGRKGDLEFHRRHSADVPASWANVNKAQRLLDWYPLITTSEGIRNLVAWYEENRNWAKEVKT